MKKEEHTYRISLINVCNTNIYLNTLNIESTPYIFYENCIVFIPKIFILPLEISINKTSQKYIHYLTIYYLH